MLQRLLGARTGRALHEHAQGRDTQVVDPTPTPASTSTEHHFARDELDPAAHRRVLLALAEDLGARLRGSGHVATGVTLKVRYADSSGTRRSRTLPEATQHTMLLARTAYAVYAPPSLSSAPEFAASPARGRPSARRPGHPAAHPRLGGRQTPRGRSRRRSRPRPLRPPGALPRRPRDQLPAPASPASGRRWPPRGRAWTSCDVTTPDARDVAHCLGADAGSTWFLRPSAHGRLLGSFNAARTGRRGRLGAWQPDAPGAEPGLRTAGDATGP
nr:hypothetical protein [Streptomyces sp. AC555_RSS877]